MVLYKSMKKVYQTKFGEDEGNCMAACIASILELDINEIPMLKDDADGSYAKKLNDFLKTRECCYVEYETGEPAVNWWVLNSGYSIISGDSPRGNCLHAVVGYKGCMVHDPHPDNQMLKNIQTVGFICLGGW